MVKDLSALAGLDQSSADKVGEETLESNSEDESETEDDIFGDSSLPGDQKRTNLYKS